MRIKYILPIIWLITNSLIAQEIKSPLQKSDYKRITSYVELTEFIQQLDQSSDILKVEVIGQSVQNRNLHVMYFSNSEFGKDETKAKVLIFAQQHGNEQSGKEGALLLAQALLKPENRYLFDNFDLALVPQVNPDGSEINQRRNANDADLNRNHLILTEPETTAIHHLFDKYLFEVTMDVHEYYPYYEEWMNLGYRKNTEVTVGAITNGNVSEKINDLSYREILPFLQDYLTSRNFSSFMYCPGGPPGNNYMRNSTFDINDGRQSLGIQNSLSFIQEGMNGKDGFIENIKNRAEGQMTGMMALLDFVYHHKKKIINLVDKERKKLIAGSHSKTVSIQSEHVKNGKKLTLPVYSLLTNTDSVITVDDYRPVVKSLHDVNKPTGYLIPAKLTQLVDWAERQALGMKTYIPSENDRIEQYFISTIDPIDFEGDTILNPTVSVNDFQGKIAVGDYFFIATSQLKGNMVVLALEPKSMLGLATYKPYADLLKNDSYFPVLRLNKNH